MRLEDSSSRCKASFPNTQVLCFSPKCHEFVLNLTSSTPILSPRNPSRGLNNEKPPGDIDRHNTCIHCIDSFGIGCRTWLPKGDWSNDRADRRGWSSNLVNTQSERDLNDGESANTDFPFAEFKAIATVGEVDAKSGLALTGYPDGQAAWLVDDETVRVVYQSESYATMGKKAPQPETYPWAMMNGDFYRLSHSYD